MEYREFLNMVKPDLEAMMPGSKVSVSNIRKLQGMSYYGISVKPEGSVTMASLNLENFHHRFEAGWDYRQILSDIVDTVREAQAWEMQIPRDDIKNYDQVKEKLSVQLVGRKGNEDKLQRIPHHDMEDMSLVYRIDLSQIGGAEGILITNELLNNYGISLEQLHRDALESAQERQPLILRSLNEIVAEILGIEVSELEGSPDLLVATNSARENGASVIAYPGFMDVMAEKMNGDFFILPSSLHEVMLVPDNGQMTYQEMEAMVLEANEMQVPPEERLTNRVYHYDCQERVFELAEKFDARMKVKEEERPSVLKSLEEYKANQVPRKNGPSVPGNEPALSM